MNRRRRLAAFAAVLWFALVFAAALLALAPASLVGALIERATGARVTLAGPAGSLWSGRGTLLGADDTARVLIDWTLSAWRLLRAEAAGELRIGAAEPVRFIAAGEQLHLERVDVVLPAALIVAAIGPYDAYRIGGRVRVRAERITLERDGATGRATIEWMDAASSLIEVAPLGSYHAELQAAADSGAVRVRTTHGPLMLDGAGRWAAGGASLQLSARADGTRADTLKAWLRTMTPEQADGSFRFLWPQPRAAQRGPRS